MKQEAGMTYDSLMGHFVNYPNHPEWLYKLFNPYVVMLTSASLFICLGYIVFSVPLGTLLIFALIMMYVFHRAISAMQNMYGHGIGLNPKRTSKVRKILVRSVIFLSVMISILLIAGFCGYNEDGNILLILLPTALTLGLIGSILIWKYHMYFVTWYGNEYDARVEFKKHGMSDQQINARIKQLRENGVLPSVSNK